MSLVSCTALSEAGNRTNSNVLPIRLLLGIMLAGLLLSACSVNRSAPVPPKQDGGSEPNLASIYYYITGSYFYYQGDFLSASELYQRALQADDHSLQIRKQVLMADINASLAGQQDKDQINKQIEDDKDLILSDDQLLNAVYSVYQQNNDYSGMKWAADNMAKRFPGSRAWLLKFLADYQSNFNGNEQDLAQAYKLARGNPNELLDVAKLYSLVDLKRSIAILQEILAITPKPEAQTLLAEYLLRSGDQGKAAEIFRSYGFPTDRQQMLSFLQSANKAKSSGVILELEPEIIATADAGLIGELAFAAYLEGQYPVLEHVYSVLASKPPEPAADAKVAVFLVAGALDSQDLKDSSRFLPLLQGAQDADDILLYRTLRFSLNATHDKDDILGTWEQETATRLPDGPWKDYLLAATKAQTASDSTLASTRLSLCNYLCNSGKGYDSDFTYVLTDYNAQGRFSEKFSLLHTALDKYPNNPLFLNDLGYSLLDYPDSLDQAGSLIFRAIELEPDNAYYQDSMAWFYYLKSDTAKAMEHIQLPLKLEQIPSEIAYHIGMILVANHNPTLARDYFRMAADDASSPAYQQKATAEIKRLYPEK